MHPKFIRYMDVEKIETLYKRLILIDLEHLPKHKQDYINGALDGCLSALGIDTPLARVLDIEPDISREQMIETLKGILRNAYPDSKEFVSGYRDESRIQELEQEYYTSDQPGHLSN